MGTISLCVRGLPVCKFLAVPARMRTGTPPMHNGIGFYLSGEISLSHERKVHIHQKHPYGDNGSPHMRTGTVKNPVRVLWLIEDESPYAFGDSSEPDTHTGIDQSLTVCIMYSCAYGKLGIWPPYAKICIWGLPYAYGGPRMHTGRDR